MNKNKVVRILWLASLISGAIAVLGYYKIVVVKYLSDYNFELLLIGFTGLLITRFLRK